MKLMTKELETAFVVQGRTSEKFEEETMVLAHYFAGSWEWWATEYYPRDRTFFGLVRGLVVKLGYFSLSELEKISCNVIPSGGIKRDLHWTPRSLATVRKEIADKEIIHYVLTGNQARQSASALSAQVNDGQKDYKAGR